jgi:hypothetical protein
MSHLKAKHLWIRAYKHAFLRGNRLIGIAKIDLHTLATGSCNLDLPLVNEVSYCCIEDSVDEVSF